MLLFYSEKSGGNKGFKKVHPDVNAMGIDIVVDMLAVRSAIR